MHTRQRRKKIGSNKRRSEGEGRRKEEEEEERKVANPRPVLIYTISKAHQFFQSVEQTAYVSRREKNGEVADYADERKLVTE